MPSNGSDHDGGESLPPSCRYILHVLEEADGRELSRQQLLDRTDLPESTLDRALQTLENEHRVLRARKSDAADRVVAQIRDSHRV